MITLKNEENMSDVSFLGRETGSVMTEKSAAQKAAKRNKCFMIKGSCTGLPEMKIEKREYSPHTYVRRPWFTWIRCL